jgi:hypothetical protein
VVPLLGTQRGEAVDDLADVLGEDFSSVIPLDLHGLGMIGAATESDIRWSELRRSGSDRLCLPVVTGI